MIFIAFIVAASVAVAFAVVVAGVQATDRRLRLRERSGHGWADRFARRVLGVYVGQPAGSGPAEDRAAHGQERR
jgi:hypothetical protein